MTVAELINKLQAFDGGLRVVARGFDESNYEDVEQVRPIRIEFHDERETFHGGRHLESVGCGEAAVFVDWGD